MHTIITVATLLALATSFQLPSERRLSENASCPAELPVYRPYSCDGPCNSQGYSGRSCDGSSSTRCDMSCNDPPVGCDESQCITQAMADDTGSDGQCRCKSLDACIECPADFVMYIAMAVLILLFAGLGGRYAYKRYFKPKPPTTVEMSDVSKAEAQPS